MARCDCPVSGTPPGHLVLSEPHDFYVADALAAQVLDEREQRRPGFADCDPVGTEPDLVALDHGGSIVAVVARAAHPHDGAHRESLTARV